MTVSEFARGVPSCGSIPLSQELIRMATTTGTRAFDVGGRVFVAFPKELLYDWTQHVPGSPCVSLIDHHTAANVAAEGKEDDGKKSARNRSRRSSEFQAKQPWLSRACMVSDCRIPNSSSVPIKHDFLCRRCCRCRDAIAKHRPSPARPGPPFDRESG